MGDLNIAYECCIKSNLAKIIVCVSRMCFGIRVHGTRLVLAVFVGKLCSLGCTLTISMSCSFLLFMLGFLFDGCLCVFSRFRCVVVLENGVCLIYRFSMAARNVQDGKNVKET